MFELCSDNFSSLTDNPHEALLSDGTDDSTTSPTVLG